MKKVKTPWYVLEEMEKTLKQFVDEDQINKDHIEDFMSFTTTALAQLCGIVDQLRGEDPFKKD